MLRKWSFGLSVGASLCVLVLVALLARISDNNVALAVSDTAVVSPKGSHTTPLLAPAPTTTQQTAMQSITQALEWLGTQQNDDGGFDGWIPGTSDVGATADVLLAFAATGASVADMPQSNSGNSMLDYLAANGAAYAVNGAGNAGKLAQAVAAAGLDPHDFGGMNLVVSMTESLDPSTGIFGAGGDFAIWTQAPAMLGMVAAGEAVPAKSVDYLKSLATDGSWGDGDSTGLALQVLAAVGESPDSPYFTDALAYLKSQQMPDGGFAGWDGTANTNSTAYAVQGILAAGHDPTSLEWTMIPTNTNPIDFLFARQQQEGNLWTSVASAGSGTSATAQAIPALVGRPFPFLSPKVALHNATNWVKWQFNQSEGSFTGYNPGASLDAVFALAATGQAMRTTGAYIFQPIDYFERQAASYAANGASAIGKMMAGVVLAGGDPRNVGGTNLVISATHLYSPTSGAYGTSTWDQAWAMLGLVAAGEPVPTQASTYLQSIAADGGGWGFSANAASASPDSTGLALQALAATGMTTRNDTIQDALDYLKQTQNHDGGISGWDGTSNANSTGLVLQALAAWGENPRATAWASTSATSLTLYSPLDSLLAMQSPQGGFKGFSGDNDPGATYQAIPGIAGSAYPNMPVNFKVSRTSGIAPLTIAFTNTSQSKSNVLWNFGDGETSTNTNDSHTFINAGIYTVSLASGTQMIARPNYIQVYAPVVAEFTASVRSGTAPLTVTFENTSIGDYDQSTWDFGDGTTSTAISPTHTYTRTGMYSVTLMVSGDGGSDTSIMPSFIEVKAETPTPTPTEPPNIAAMPYVQAAMAALDWLREQQQADGGYGTSNSSIDSLVSIGVARKNANAWRYTDPANPSLKGNALLDNIRNNAIAYASVSPAQACKLVLAVSLAGENPRNFKGLDTLDLVKQDKNYDAATGTYGSNNWDQALCILAMYAAGEPIDTKSAKVLKDRMHEDGYWAYGVDEYTDFSYTDTTGLVLQALAAAGVANDDPVVLQAIEFLHQEQRSDGGFADLPPVGGGEPDNTGNANTTSFIVQGLIAVGQDPTATEWTTTGMTPTHPISFLLSLQQDNGSVLWKADSDPAFAMMATKHVIPGLLGQSLVIRGKGAAAHKGVTWIVGQQGEDGSFDSSMGATSTTIDACLALASTNAFDQINTQKMLNYLDSQAAAYATSANATGKLLACIAQAGGDIANIGGMNLVDTVNSFYDSTTGAYGSNNWDQAWAMIGLKLAGEAIPAEAVTLLLDRASENGSWNYGPGIDYSHIDTTALVLQALAAAGVQPTTTLAANGADAGLSFLRTQQLPSGGWAGYDGITSANSTGLVIQALVAMGEDPQATDWMMGDISNTSAYTLHTPLDALLALQSPEGGFKGYSGDNDPLATYQAIPGVAQQSFVSAQPVALLTAQLSVSATRGGVPFEVAFTNTSEGAYTTSQWNFGDGEMSFLTQPSHTYTTAGTYTVTLTIAGTNGTTATKTLDTPLVALTQLYLPMVNR